jgi:hypothetical protein
MKDNDTKMNKVCYAYIDIASKIYEKAESFNESTLKPLRDQICIAESQILKVIDFEFDFKLPNDFLEILVRKYFNKGWLKNYIYKITFS